ncbi:MAG TPA: PEP-CTERM sorting domain-containing protein [Vicinamibacterales bacterium]|jgi:hypothetical protein|nr:PEP-CTERM sorting domain-containing protein [Vicinamibacterales bacterium]
MRRIVLALLVAVVGSARFASGAAISVAGAECGTGDLLGLQFTTLTGSNVTSNACPDNNLGVGRIVDSTGSTPLYGSSITSIDLAISSVPTDGIDILQGSAFSDILPLGNNVFRLFGGTGIQITCGSPISTADFIVCSPKDAVITFSGFAPNTAFDVTAVNPVPEPATSALLLSGLGAALVRRVRRRRT